MIKHEEILFNLFIMAFMDWHLPQNQFGYDLFADKGSVFYRIKDCFPENEVCLEDKQLDNYSECKYLGKNPEYIIKKYNYIED